MLVFQLVQALTVGFATVLLSAARVLGRLPRHNKDLIMLVMT